MYSIHVSISKRINLNSDSEMSITNYVSLLMVDAPRVIHLLADNEKWSFRNDVAQGKVCRCTSNAVLKAIIRVLRKAQCLKQGPTKPGPSRNHNLVTWSTNNRSGPDIMQELCGNYAGDPTCRF